jgi:hypothetical protein
MSSLQEPLTVDTETLRNLIKNEQMKANSTARNLYGGNAEDDIVHTETLRELIRQDQAGGAASGAAADETIHTETLRELIRQDQAGGAASGAASGAAGGAANGAAADETIHTETLRELIRQDQAKQSGGEPMTDSIESDTLRELITDIQFRESARRNNAWSGDGGDIDLTTSILPPKVEVVSIKRPDEMIRDMVQSERKTQAGGGRRPMYKPTDTESEISIDYKLANSINHILKGMRR